MHNTTIVVITQTHNTYIILMATKSISNKYILLMSTQHTCIITTNN